MDARWGSSAVVQLLEGGLLWAVLGVGCYACYTDVRWRRLSNTATWGLLGMGLAGHSAFWLLGMSGLVQMVGVWAVSFGVGYLLYRYGLWAAGDAKLFAAVAVALPPTLFRPAPLFSTAAPLWALLVNILLVNGLLVGVVGLWPRRRLASPAVTAGWRHSLWAALELAGLVALVLGLGSRLRGAPLHMVEAAALVLVSYLLAVRFIAAAYRRGLALPGLLWGFYLSWADGVGWLSLALWGFVWGVYLLYERLRRQGGGRFVQRWPVLALQPGMIPCQAVCSPAGTATAALYPQEQLPTDQEVLCYPGRPLTAGQVRRLRTLAAQGGFQRMADRLAVELTVPLAPAMLVGTVLTVLLAGRVMRPLAAGWPAWLG